MWQVRRWLILEREALVNFFIIFSHKKYEFTGKEAWWPHGSQLCHRPASRKNWPCFQLQLCKEQCNDFMTFLQLREAQNSPDSKHHIPRGATAKSSEVSSGSVTDLGLDETYQGYFDGCHCLTLWWMRQPVPPSSIPYHSNCKAKIYISPNTSQRDMQTGSASKMPAFLRDSERRGHLLTVSILAREAAGSYPQQRDASSYS